MRENGKLLTVWVKSFFSRKLKNIVVGAYSLLFGRNGALYRNRVKICKDCPYKESYKRIGDVCGICGCPLKTKLRVKDETCGDGRW